jgi:hypothetical protein
MRSNGCNPRAKPTWFKEAAATLFSSTFRGRAFHAQLDYSVPDVALLGEGQHVTFSILEFVKDAISILFSFPSLLPKRRQLPLKIIDVPKIELSGMRIGFLLIFRSKRHN